MCFYLLTGVYVFPVFLCLTVGVWTQLSSVQALLLTPLSHSHFEELGTPPSGQAVSEASPTGKTSPAVSLSLYVGCRKNEERHNGTFSK